MRCSLINAKKASNNKLSFSDILASQFVDSKDPIFINRLNKLQKALNNDFMSYYQANFDVLVSNHDSNKYSREAKYDSRVCAKIYLSEAFLLYSNIRIDLALKAIDALVHCPNIDKNSYFRLPSKYLSIRTGLSEKKLYSLIQLLSTLELLEVKHDMNNILYIKLSKEIIEDSWVEEIYYYSKLEIYKSYIKAQDTGSIYHYGISKYTLGNNLRQSIINITLAFNHLIDTDPVLKKQYAINGNRTDIIYAHFPIDLISFITGKSESIIRKNLDILCEKTEIISKHDKVYITTNGIDHYIENSYQHCSNLVSAINTTLEEGHPPVDENSIIWHSDKLINSKYYKKFKKHEQEIISSIDFALVLFTIKNKISITINFDNIDKFQDNEDQPYKLTSNDIRKYGELFNCEEGERCTSVVALEEWENIEKHSQKKAPYISNGKTLRKFSIGDLVKAYKRTMWDLVNCSKRALNHLTKQREFIIELIKDKVYDLSKTTNYKRAVKWKNYIENLANIQNAETCKVIYDYIQIDLYERYDDRLNDKWESSIIETDLDNSYNEIKNEELQENDQYAWDALI